MANSRSPGRSPLIATAHRTRVVLELPKSASTPSRILRLGALAPLVTDRPWRLPRIQPEEVFWREGHATLLVPSPLRIDKTRRDPLSAVEGRASVGAAGGRVDRIAVLLGRRHRRSRPLVSRIAPCGFDCGTALELSGGGVTSRMIAAFASLRPGAIRVGTRIGPAMDHRFGRHSIENDMVADWSIQPRPRGSAENWSSVWPRPSLQPGDPFTFRLSARRLQSPLGRTLKVDDLTPLSFPGATRRKTMGLRPSNGTVPNHRSRGRTTHA